MRLLPMWGSVLLLLIIMVVLMMEAQKMDLKNGVRSALESLVHQQMFAYSNPTTTKQKLRLKFAMLVLLSSC
jgi:hypothetical protein